MSPISLTSCIIFFLAFIFSALVYQKVHKVGLWFHHDVPMSEIGKLMMSGTTNTMIKLIKYFNSTIEPTNENFNLLRQTISYFGCRYNDRSISIVLITTNVHIRSFVSLTYARSVLLQNMSHHV